MERLTSFPRQQFQWSADPKSLRDSYEKTEFDSVFHQFIAKDVINIMSPQLAPEPYNLEYDEEKIHQHLLGPLEKFILGLNEKADRNELKERFDFVQTFNQSSKLCRRILKTGDVVFSCNDCSLDESCICCIDCFHKSSHKNHNYRMLNSGGGCCDCGDPEAWKQNYACTDHMGTSQTSASLSDFEDIKLRSKQVEIDKLNCNKIITGLPDGISERYFLVCQAALHYARTMISWEDYHSLPHYLDFVSVDESDLKSKTKLSKNYLTVLFNDEVHTYDFVINTLVKIIKCSKMTASITASNISREGRSYIINSNHQSCKRVRDMVTSVRDEGQHPLKVEVIHGAVLAHQEFALKVIKWIRDLCKISDSFRILTAYTLLGTFNFIPGQEHHVEDRTLVEKVMLSNTTYWKAARVEWNDLFMMTLLTDYSTKEQCARLITRIYSRLMHYFVQDDHDHTFSVLKMTTQLYTVPSLICMLIEEEDALTIITQTLYDICRKAKRDNPTLSFENRRTFDMRMLRRGFYIVSDLIVLINIQPTKWTDRLKHNVINAVTIFLNLLQTIQNMDSVKRQQGQHVEYEPDWESGMTLQSRLVALITRLVTYCSYNDEVLVAVLQKTQTKLFDQGFKYVWRTIFGYSALCVMYEVSIAPVSVHLPLTRFAAALIIELMQRRPSKTTPYEESLIIVADQVPRLSESETSSMFQIMEHSLRTLVMVAQFRSGMWRRNGYSLINQLLYYHGISLRKEMFDRDILMIQEFAATCDANKFIIHLLNKFQLFTWILNETTRESSIGSRAVGFHNDAEILGQTLCLGEEFLQLILTVVSERYQVGVGQVEEDDVTKNWIIQMLCISPSTRSELMLGTEKELACIQSVAKLKRSTSVSTAKYELKEEFYDRFNPFFYHYSRSQQSNALDVQLKRKKNLQESELVCCPPPAPVELTSQFRNLNEILRCDIMLILIEKILKRALGPDPNVQDCSTNAPMRFTVSDLQLDQSLHLIGLALYEQEREPMQFKYIQAAHSRNVFTLLKDCYEIAKRSKDLVYWLMKKCDALIDRMQTTQQYWEELSECERQIMGSIRDCFKPVLSTCDSANQASKKRNSELAVRRRAQIMAMMKAKQEQFLSNPTTKQLLAETSSKSAPAANADTASRQSDLMDCDEADERQDDELEPAGHNRACQDSAGQAPSLVEPAESSHLCILCRDEQLVNLENPTMVLLAYVQRSAVLSKNRDERRIPNFALTPTNRANYSLTASAPDVYSFTSDNSRTYDATFMPADLFFGPHVSSCGHVMHYDCWRGFHDSIMRRDSSRPNRSARHVSYEPDKHELLCPLCECISNANIPLLPNYFQFGQRRRPTKRPPSIFMREPQEVSLRSGERLSALLRSLRAAVDTYELIRHVGATKGITVSHEHQYVRLLQPKPLNDVLEQLDEGEALGLRDFINVMRSNSVCSPTLTKSLLSSISTLAQRIHSVGLDLGKGSAGSAEFHHARTFMMTSWSVAYTIQAHERASRFRGSPVLEQLEASKHLCLSSLLRFACSSMMTHQPDMIQSLLVRKLRYLIVPEDYLGASPSVLDIDAFETFVSLAIMLQKLYTHFEGGAASPAGAGAAGNKSQPEAGDEQPMDMAAEPGPEAHLYPWTTRAYDHDYFRSLLHLCCILNLVQVIISLQSELESAPAAAAAKDEELVISSSTASPPAAQPQPPGPQDHEWPAVHNFYKELMLASGHPNKLMPTVDGDFCSELKRRLLPFLRSCAIFYFYLSHVRPPECLRTQSAFNEGRDFGQHEQQAGAAGPQPAKCAQEEPEHWPANQVDSRGRKLAACGKEFDAICQYLDLPAELAALVSSQEARQLARSWLRHSRVLELVKSQLGAAAAAAAADEQPAAPTAAAAAGHSQEAGSGSSGASGHCTELMPVRLVRQPHLVNRLIALPFDYSELVDKVSDFMCPSIRNEDSRTPTLCLVCGVMLCSQSYCCQRDLNDLAANYQQILQQQQQQAAAAAAAAGPDEPARPLRASAAWARAQPQQHELQASSEQQAAVAAAAARQLTHAQLESIGLATRAVLLRIQQQQQQDALAATQHHHEQPPQPPPQPPQPQQPQHETNEPATGAPAAALSQSSAASAAGALVAAAAAAAAAANLNLTVHQQLVGSCTYHAYECSAGVGVFLRIRNCQVLLMSGRSKGCYLPAPYIDDHGETDFGLLRGNPLHLNPQLYERLQQMWLTHAIPEQISRTLEYSPNAANINWYLH